MVPAARGTDDWWAAGTRYERPSWAEAATPLERISLFQRARSSIPMSREADARLDKLPKNIENRIV